MSVGSQLTLLIISHCVHKFKRAGTENAQTNNIKKLKELILAKSFYLVLFFPSFLSARSEILSEKGNYLVNFFKIFIEFDSKNMYGIISNMKYEVFFSHFGPIYPLFHIFR